MSDAQLEILASQAGLAVDWIDANGRPQKVQPAVLRAILTGLGHPAGSAQEIDASLLELQQRQALNRLPPLLTVDVGSGLDLSRYFAAHTPCEIQLEDGAILNLKLDDDAVLPGLLPVGYQEVSIAGQYFTLAVAPLQCHSVAAAVDSEVPRAWGISVQLYALRRAGDGGFGDTQALETLARVAGERGAEAGREVDTFDFAAGQCAGLTIEREVAEPDFDQIAEARGNFRQHHSERGIGGIFDAVGRLQLFEQFQQIADR